MVSAAAVPSTVPLPLIPGGHTEDAGSGVMPHVVALVCTGPVVHPETGFVGCEGGCAEEKTHIPRWALVEATMGEARLIPWKATFGLPLEGVVGGPSRPGKERPSTIWVPPPPENQASRKPPPVVSVGRCPVAVVGGPPLKRPERIIKGVL